MKGEHLRTLYICCFVLQTWDYYITGPTDNTYYLKNKYTNTAGTKLLTFQFDTSTYQPLTGFCISNADRLSTSPSDYSSVSLYTEHVEENDHTSSAIYGGSTTDNLYCFEPNMVCSCIKLVNITATSLKQSVANLKRDLRIDKKNTLLGTYVYNTDRKILVNYLKYF